MKTDAISIGLLAGIWATALAGIALKLFLPGRFDRFSVCLYLILGWSGVLAYDSLIEPLSALTLALLAVGGALYSIGVIFHTRRGLRFQNAVWHSFLLAAASAIISRYLRRWPLRRTEQANAKHAGRGLLIADRPPPREAHRWGYRQFTASACCVSSRPAAVPSGQRPDRMQACRLRAACPTIVRADVGASDWATLHRPTGATTSETITGGGSLHCRAAWTGSTGRQCHIDIYQLYPFRDPHRRRYILCLHRHD